jgi:LysM repeat protein
MRRFYQAIALLTAFVLLGAVSVFAQQGDEQPGQTYFVREGETVEGISDRLEVAPECILAANDLLPDVILEVGQELFIPDDCDALADVGGGAIDPLTAPEAESLEAAEGASVLALTQDVAYTVVAGDRLAKIAERYGVTVTCLVRANNIANPNLIFVGQQLVIPADCQGGGGGETSGGGGGVTRLDLTCQFDRYPGREAPGGLYTIRAGDTLDFIACDFGISLQCLLESNPQITNTKRVPVGSQISINTACPPWDVIIP